MDQCIKEDRPFPKFIEERPSLIPGLELYWYAFMELTSDRGIGINGESWIPWSSIRLYCKELGLSPEQTTDMHYLIKQMDSAYLNHVRKKK